MEAKRSRGDLLIRIGVGMLGTALIGLAAQADQLVLALGVWGGTGVLLTVIGAAQKWRARRE